MSNFAIKAENLGKKYRIGVKKEPYQTFRESLAQAIGSPFRKMRDLLAGHAYGASNSSQDFWALKDISFEIKHGDVVGIVGRNGAGKSTLLKILSRITEPSTGYVDIYGRVGALLEVGTGFHPELTGRENVYLNGTILGMGRKEIERKFDEIVDFAGVEQFIDTPVKHYSSGMGLRLGFAVAAYLEPEILVVDEVLAVGDAEFQKKCLGKMQDVAGEGRTVLFVSHNLGAVTSLCKSAYLLSQGNLVTHGTASEVISVYSQNSESIAQQDLSKRQDRTGTGDTRIHSIAFRNSEGILTDMLMSGENISVELDYESKLSNKMGKVSINLVFVNNLGTRLFSCWSDIVNADLQGLHSCGKLICRLPDLPLVPGQYFLNVALVIDGRSSDVINEAASFAVSEGAFYSTGKLPSANQGNVLVEYSWEAN